MKKLLLLLFVLGLINISFAQNETNIWCFGYGAGVDFNSGTPVGINGGNTFTIEGTASICDTAGSLLFYTDGITVWNKNHNVMISGNNLDGGYSSTQSALIVQQPGSDSIYFIFTTAESAGSNGLRYSIVDMSLNIGEGEVILKDEPLIGFMTEKVTAAKHSNDVTLITLNANGSDTLLLPDYITVYTTPPFPIITQNGNTLTASPADSYQWQLNLVDVSGATNQTYEATQSGLYTVIITDSNGCTNSATIDVVFTGMENFFPNAHLSIYPNPSNGSFTVEMMNSIAEKEITIKLLNAIGKEVYTVSERISGEKFKKEIHLTDKPYGFYLLRIEMSEFTFNQSVILN
jgi:hypothetical protein